MDEQPIAESPLRHPDLIIPRLYLCDLHTAQDPAVTTFLGITHVISVLDFNPTFPNEMQHVKKLHVMLSDNFREKITPHLENITAFIREALESNSENKILVCVPNEEGAPRQHLKKWLLTRVPER
jgi:atypical dual specificity phosphatase